MCLLLGSSFKCAWAPNRLGIQPKSTPTKTNSLLLKPLGTSLADYFPLFSITGKFCGTCEPGLRNLLSSSWSSTQSVWAPLHLWFWWRPFQCQLHFCFEQNKLFKKFLKKQLLVIWGMRLQSSPLTFDLPYVQFSGAAQFLPFCLVLGRLGSPDLYLTFPLSSALLSPPGSSPSTRQLGSGPRGHARSGAPSLIRSS